ncbi:hypothetical protein BCR33DRAFT_415691 [Rhizoclosmatium globosum]|uniref:Uncharacterized protein n=1 Tax=Rhizoclosmatium globosum TaxID=329046 RepID=A0A1Y2BW75_9FUNG|nr:hypothetical protein BCR33DRAFT_415691 [Rhizoclosmatium globosum]|eukprot:ORY38993.1 hypothetical protein BCR33DRAFT_415691 [Rhizoclosmatium globosum]
MLLLLLLSKGRSPSRCTFFATSTSSAAFPRTLSALSFLSTFSAMAATSASTPLSLPGDPLLVRLRTSLLILGTVVGRF